MRVRVRVRVRGMAWHVSKRIMQKGEWRDIIMALHSSPIASQVCLVPEGVFASKQGCSHDHLWRSCDSRWRVWLSGSLAEGKAKKEKYCLEYRANTIKEKEIPCALESSSHHDILFLGSGPRRRPRRRSGCSSSVAFPFQPSRVDRWSLN